MVCFHFNTLWRCRRGLGAEPGARLSPPAPRPAPRIRTRSRSRLTRGRGSFAAVVGASGARQSGHRHRRGTTPGALPQRWSSTGADRQTDRQTAVPPAPPPAPFGLGAVSLPWVPQGDLPRAGGQGSKHGPAERAGSIVTASRGLASCGQKRSRGGHQRTGAGSRRYLLGELFMWSYQAEHSSGRGRTRPSGSQPHPQQRPQAKPSASSGFAGAGRGQWFFVFKCISWRKGIPGKAAFQQSPPIIPPEQPQGPGSDEGCPQPGGTPPHARTGLGSPAAPGHQPPRQPGAAPHHWAYSRGPCSPRALGLQREAGAGRRKGVGCSVIRSLGC